MSHRIRGAVLGLRLPLVLILPVSASIAETSAVGAMPNDKAITCEMVAAERAAIHDTVAARSLKKEKSAKLKKGLFGFAKGMASVMVPGAAMLGGGGSMIGSLAAQGASQSAAQMIASSGNGAPKPVAAAEPTAEQQARLTRLDMIGSYRQCAA